jgi:hypothetical protein
MKNNIKPARHLEINYKAGTHPTGQRSEQVDLNVFAYQLRPEVLVITTRVDENNLPKAGDPILVRFIPYGAMSSFSESFPYVPPVQSAPAAGEGMPLVDLDAVRKQINSQQGLV